MIKKILVWLLATVLLTTVSLAEAQQPAKIPRIGFVSGSGDANNPGPTIEPFRQRLRELGYIIEGKNILIEIRYVEGQQDRIPGLVAELVQLMVDILVSGTLRAIRAAKQATKTIPVVMAINGDPVALGLVDSLARPGGNITGLTSLNRELSGKRLELFKEAVPQISRVGVLTEPTPTTDSGTAFEEYGAAARALKISLQLLKVSGSNPDLEGALSEAVKGRATGLIITSGGVLFRHGKRLADLAIKHRLPSMFERTGFVEAGGLIYYSSSDTERSRRAAEYVAKILKGTTPADLPVEQPMKFEFVVNLKTAKQIGVTIAPEVLARANRIIR